jgi:hypothetical protein
LTKQLKYGIIMSDKLKIQQNKLENKQKELFEQIEEQIRDTYQPTTEKK